MTWVRFDDQFPIHRKVAGLNDAAFRTHTEAVFWCARNTTDGIIRAHEINQIRARADRHTDELVAHEIWHQAGQLCRACTDGLAAAGRAEPTDGWLIHDYLKFQPSRAKIEKEKAAKADRQTRWLEAKKNGGRRVTPPSTDASHPPSTDASEDAAPRDANPAPAPPRRKRGGEPAPSDRTPPLRTAASGDGRNPENPDWRTLPAIGVPRDPIDADRAHRGAAAARSQLRRPPKET